MEAREIMTKDVITLTPETSIGEAIDLLLRYRIHGAPVVGADGQLLGMVSFLDLARHAGEDVPLRMVMSPDPVAASEDASVEEVARLMLDEMVRRIPIVQAGKVVGLISASDIVQLFVNLHEQPRQMREKAGKGRRGR